MTEYKPLKTCLEKFQEVYQKSGLIDPKVVFGNKIPEDILQAYYDARKYNDRYVTMMIQEAASYDDENEPGKKY